MAPIIQILVRRNQAPPVGRTLSDISGCATRSPVGRRSRQSLSCERSARMRLQIFFELQGFILVGKGTIPNQLPRNKLGRMRRLLRIMVSNSLLQVSGGADVVLIR